MKNYKKKRFIIASIILVIIFSFNTLAEFRESDKKLRKEFEKINKDVQIDHINYKGKRLRYYSPETIDSLKPTILFIHGAPGTGSNYFEYLKDVDLMRSANLISLDRLGYGYSDLGNALTSISEQAESIYAIIEKHKLKNVIVFAWSFGVPIAGKMASMHPEIKHSFLIAGAVSPTDEKYFVLGKLAHWKSTRWLLPKSFRVADEEKCTHEEELELMREDWSKIKTPVTYYHGSKDWIVPYENMNFIKNHVNPTLLNVITIDDKGHFILFSEFETIKKELMSYL